MSFTREYLNEVRKIAGSLDWDPIEESAEILRITRDGGGRLFILGVGGSAGNASHAVNDFRKITGIEAYAPTDNVSELTARTNDEGWATVFAAWLKGSHLKSNDTLLILSVGGGNLEKNVSPNLVAALDYAKSVGSKIIGIVGRDGGYTAKVANACIIIPTVNPDHVTPHSESFQAVVWHLLVSHPLLKQTVTKWESVALSRAVFFDRDGTLTLDQFSPESLDDLKIAPDAFSSLTALKEAGFKLVMVTNQPDVDRGVITLDFVEEINEVLNLPFDKISICPHVGDRNCKCRKPGTLLFKQAAKELDIDLKRSYMVGDTWRDVEAGFAAGCKTVWINRSGFPLTYPDRVAHATAESLAAATRWILEDSK